MIEKVLSEMICYFGNDARRINHALKVYSFSRTIGLCERINDNQIKILEGAAVLHDIGIKESEKKYNSSSGRYQEIEGPPVARKIFENCGYSESEIDRMCYLIGHHHTYDKIDGMDYQILIEADFLVNIYEDEMKKEAIEVLKGKYFKTKTGLKIINDMYL